MVSFLPGNDECDFRTATDLSNESRNRSEARGRANLACPGSGGEFPPRVFPVLETVAAKFAGAARSALYNLRENSGRRGRSGCNRLRASTQGTLRGERHAA